VPQSPDDAPNHSPDKASSLILHSLILLVPHYTPSKTIHQKEQHKTGIIRLFKTLETRTKIKKVSLTYLWEQTDKTK
jgi:hypothetical protein